MNGQLTQTSGTGIERIALIVITLVGMAICTQGIGKVAAAGQR